MARGTKQAAYELIRFGATMPFCHLFYHFHNYYHTVSRSSNRHCHISVTA